MKRLLIGAAFYMLAGVPLPIYSANTTSCCSATLCKTQCGKNSCEPCSRTFFRPRPLSQDLGLQNTLSFYDVQKYCWEDSADVCIQTYERLDKKKKRARRRRKYTGVAYLDYYGNPQFPEKKQQNNIDKIDDYISPDIHIQEERESSDFDYYPQFPEEKSYKKRKKNTSDDLDYYGNPPEKKLSIRKRKRKRKIDSNNYYYAPPAVQENRGSTELDYYPQFPEEKSYKKRKKNTSDDLDYYGNPPEKKLSTRKRKNRRRRKRTEEEIYPNFPAVYTHIDYDNSNIIEHKKLQEELAALDHAIELVDHKLELMRNEPMNTTYIADENMVDREIDLINQEIDRLHAQRFNTYDNQLRTSIDVGCQSYEGDISCQEDVPCKSWFTCDVKWLYYHSTNKCELAEYFLPCCQQSISIEQDPTNRTDINSPWLCIYAPNDSLFKSGISIAPQRKLLSAAFNCHIDFSPWINCLWADLFVPLVWVRHNLNFEEHLVRPGGGDLHREDPNNPGEFTTVSLQSFTNAEQAFNNPSWKYGKLFTSTNNKTKTKGGVDDILLKIGWDMLCGPDYNAHIFANFYIPTGKKSNPTYLFEPTFGSGGHAGFGAGLSGSYALCVNDQSIISLLSELRYAYFIKGTELRSIDLNNGEWSRYLLLAQQENNTGSFVLIVEGINVLTQCVDVTPGSMVNFWLGCHYQRGSCNFEIGYDLWWRDEENICLTSCCEDLNKYVILDMFAITAGNDVRPVTSASTATICKAYDSVEGVSDSDSSPVRLQKTDLNLKSAQHKSALTSKLTVAFSHQGRFCCRKANIGLGLSYEFAHRHSALSQFGIWLRTGIDF